MNLHKHLVWFPIVAASIAGIWALYTFYYKERLREEQSTAYLVLEGTLENKGRRDDLIAVQATINMTNPSSSKVYVLVDYFNVHGIKIGKTHTTDEEYREFATSKLEEKSYTYLSRLTQVDEDRIVFSGQIFDWPGVWWLEPDESLVAERIFYVPRTFDFLKMTAVLYYCRDDRVFDAEIFVNPDDLSLNYKIRFSDSAREKHPGLAGKEFDWDDPAHLELQKTYRNAEIKYEERLALTTQEPPGAEPPERRSD